MVHRAIKGVFPEMPPGRIGGAKTVDTVGVVIDQGGQGIVRRQRHS